MKDKLTNGFITDVKPDSSNLYTEEEVKALLGRVVNDFNEAYVDKFLGNTKTVKFNLRDWFNKNKKS